MYMHKTCVMFIEIYIIVFAPYHYLIAGFVVNKYCCVILSYTCGLMSEITVPNLSESSFKFVCIVYR